MKTSRIFFKLEENTLEIIEINQKFIRILL